MPCKETCGKYSLFDYEKLEKSLLELCNTLQVIWPKPLILKKMRPRDFSQACIGQFSHSIVSDSLRPRGLQHTRLSCLSPTPGACSNSCPSSRWCHSTISSSVVPFSSCLQSLPASGSFQMSQFFASGGQSIGVSASASVLSKNIQDWFPLWWTGLITLLSKRLSRVFSNTTVQKHQFFHAHRFLYGLILTFIHDYWKKHSFN